MRLAIGLTALLLAVGCGREQVHDFTVPKEQPTKSDAQSQSIQNPHAPGELSKPAWTVPAGWTDKGASGMRVGSFSVAGPNGQTADVSVIPLASWAGRELENVNRWRAQVSLPPITANDLPKNTATVEIAGGQGQLYEMSGTAVEDGIPKRILSAVLPLPGVAWFFKMIGHDALVLEQKTAFTAFLKSVKLEQTSPPGPASPAESPSPPPSQAMTEGKPKWTLPAGWQEQPPGRMQLARFVATDSDGGKAEVSVATLGGDGGGTLANVNRWRQQLGLPPVNADGLAKLATSLDLGGTTAILVDMTADNKQNRLIAAIVPRNDQTWFFKLTGSDAAVGRQKESFLKFIQSAP